MSQVVELKNIRYSQLPINDLTIKVANDVMLSVAFWPSWSKQTFFTSQGAEACAARIDYLFMKSDNHSTNTDFVLTIIQLLVHELTTCSF